MSSSPRPSLTIETALYLALASVALAIRLYGLGAQPLTDAEAHDALVTFRFLRGGETRAPSNAVTPAMPSSPLLFSLTSLAFLIFGASDTTARLAPALAGAALVLTPAYFRRELGRVAALGAAGLMVISPPLIAASRTADAAMIVALAVMVAAGSFARHAYTSDRRDLHAAAVAAGAALAGGPRWVTLLAILLVAGGLWRLLDAEGMAAWMARNRTSSWLSFGGIALATLIVASSALLVYRPGLAAAAQALPNWIAGWSPAAASRGWLHLPALLLVYEPLVVFVGAAGMMRVAWRRQEQPSGAWPLVAWGMAALVVGLVYPGRTSEDAVWIVIPLTGLASLFVAQLLGGDWSQLDLSAVAAHAGLVVILLIYAGLNVAAFSEGEKSLLGNPLANIGLAGTSLVLVIVVSLLFGVGWSAAGAARGALIGLGLALLFANLSAAGRITYAGEHREIAAEIWGAGAPAPASGLRMLARTLEEVSDRAVGDPHDMEITVNAPRDGALAWSLRDFHAATYTDSLAATITAPAVIAPAEQATPELGSAYVGQAFAVRGSLDAVSFKPLDWVGWLAFRRAPVNVERIVLWVRSDVQFRTRKGQTP